MRDNCLVFIKLDIPDADKDYLDWINKNANGYVLNIPKNHETISFELLSKTTRIHKASCHLISKYSKTQKSSSFTGRNYFKVCSVNESDLTEKAISMTKLSKIQPCKCMSR